MPALVSLDSVYVVKVKGREYHYAWRGQGAPRLRERPGSAAYMEELSEHLINRKLGDKSRISGIIAGFKASDEWLKDISQKTRDSWKTWLDRINDEFGELPSRALDRPAMRVAVRKWHRKYKATPRAADLGLQVFSRVCSWARGEGLIQGDNNPTKDVPRFYDTDRSGIIWTEADLDDLKVSSPIVWEAAKLASLVGLRQADCLRLGPAHRKANHLEITTGKSRHRKVAIIPLYDALRDFLDGLPKREAATTYLVNSYGLPWGTGFGSSWQDAISKAGIDKHFHDLRGTAATTMFLAYRRDLGDAEAKSMVAEAMTWSEEDVDALIKRYVSRDELMKDRITRLNVAQAK